ncbi:hypothetical protein B0A67_21410 [Flavobacterium aquidurense]|jgi:hypothetical protein|uniref:DUF6428 family protein n=1 Tax=Flavobacterium aquidurense TaxID=362413 RepID=UPI00090F0B50|nr:DUF6428 family protein [Flavobacterium aquidurense]OXA68160.1 hypothetical protein B0A67_21410 [Flavobacterium aquidurense]SHH59031.1 hypothetical protein SAMN05444481_12054 [Flavobacterium frigidimaris]
MKLSEIKKILATVEAVNFQLPDGKFVPEYFHVAEVGLVTKNFIDCGGVVRKETVVNFQLWDANDYEHRLKPQKLIHIITLSEKVLGIEDFEIEVEYQNTTIGKYDLDFNGKDFLLLNKTTACLAQDQCGIPSEKSKLKLTQLSTDEGNSCTPGGSCC